MMTNGMFVWHETRDERCWLVSDKNNNKSYTYWTVRCRVHTGGYLIIWLWIYGNIIEFMHRLKLARFSILHLCCRRCLYKIYLPADTEWLFHRIGPTISTPPYTSSPSAYQITMLVVPGWGDGYEVVDSICVFMQFDSVHNHSLT